MAADDPGNVLEADDALAAGVHDDLVEVLGPLDLHDRAHHVLGLAVLKASSGEVDVLLGEAGHHLFDGQAQARHPALVDLDLDLLLQASGDDGPGHPLDSLDHALDFAVPDQAQAHELFFSGQADAYDGIEGGVVAQEDGPDGVVGKLQEIETLPDVEGREVHVGAPAELQRDLAAVGPGAGGDGHHAVDHADRVFHGAGEQGLDLGGGGALELGSNGERGVGDVGEQVDGQVAEGDEAEDDPGQGEYRDRDRPARGEVDDVHDGGGGGLASAARATPACRAAGELVGVVTSGLALPVHLIAAAG